MKWASYKERKDRKCGGIHIWFWSGWIVVCLMVLSVGWVSDIPNVAGDRVNFRTARRLAPAVLPVEKVTTRASVPIRVLYMECTAYAPTVAECDGDPLTTASGQKVRVGGVAADWRVLPRGSIITIEGYNNGEPCTVIDQGGAIRGNKLDVFFWQSDEAVHWGRRHNVRVEVLYIPGVSK